MIVAMPPLLPIPGGGAAGRRALRALTLLAATALPAAPVFAQPAAVDYLSFAQGALPVSLSGDAESLRMGMEQALRIIDGNPVGFSLTPRPGTASQSVVITYSLPARTTFSAFAVPNVLETPSPSQTFVKQVEVAGSDVGPDGPFTVLAAATLTRHAGRNDTTVFAASATAPVRWVRVTLSGGLDVQRDQTFFEFSELVGMGRQDAVPMVETFTGKWSGRGVQLELRQVGARVTGCYDTVGDLSGTVTGNLLRATGVSRDGGISSTFVLAVTDSGHITGVRSTNGAPFRQYDGAPTATLRAECRTLEPPPLACGAVLHGITFDFDSDVIREESGPLLDELAAGLQSTNATGITVVGHTSGEGAEAYNTQLSARRAAAVVAALTARGVAADRIASDGRGESEPIADNATEAGRSLNRRVEIRCR